MKCLWRSAIVFVVVLLIACDVQRLLDETSETTIQPIDDNYIAETGVVSGQLATTEVEASVWIGKSGGRLVIEGAVNGVSAAHELVVMQNAVSNPTFFTMKLASDTYVAVDLRAQRDTDGDGDLDDVGQLGFSKPVKLQLSYAGVTTPSDPQTLSIVYLPPDGSKPLKLPTTASPSSKQVVAKLAHFSRYAMAAN